MPNNPAEDMYNPPGNLDADYEPVRFDEIEDEDLFWKYNANNDKNPAYSKMNDTQGYNTRTSIVEDFAYNAPVFQRN